MNQQFNLTSLIVLVSVLAIGLFVIYIASKVEERRQRKIMEKRFPSATPRKFSKEVDEKLDFDFTENFYHK